MAGADRKDGGRDPFRSGRFARRDRAEHRQLDVEVVGAPTYRSSGFGNPPSSRPVVLVEHMSWAFGWCPSALAACCSQLLMTEERSGTLLATRSAFNGSDRPVPRARTAAEEIVVRRAVAAPDARALRRNLDRR